MKKLILSGVISVVGSIVVFAFVFYLTKNSTFAAIVAFGNIAVIDAVYLAAEDLRIKGEGLGGLVVISAFIEVMLICLGFYLVTILL